MAEQITVGIIGVGLLGEALARRLLGAGFSVTGFDLVPERTARLAALGGRPAHSISAVAQAARFIVLAVLRTEQVEQVVEHELMPVAGGNSGKVIDAVLACGEEGAKNG